jgi:hypothetical protein
MAMFLVSCNNSENILEGKWYIIDIVQEDTDTLTNLTIPIIINEMNNDNVNYAVFTNDKKYNLVNNKKEIIKTKTYSINNNLLIIKDGNKIDKLEIIKKSDSLINLKSQNNIILTLQKVEK